MAELEQLIKRLEDESKAISKDIESERNISGLKTLVEMVDKELKNHQMEEAAKENVLYWIDLQQKTAAFTEKVKQDITLTDEESDKFE